MKVIRIQIISASVVTLLLLMFGCYQFFILGNVNVVKGPADSGFSFIVSALVMVFFFILGLVGLLPSMSALFMQGTLTDRLFPICVTVFSILLTFGILFISIMPAINMARAG